MGERNGKTPIEITQRWLEQYIIGKHICPPLARITRPHTNRDGTVNWQEIKDMITFYDFFTQDPSGTRVLNASVDIYRRFLQNADRGQPPISKLVILPDFMSNTSYDSFLAKVQINTGISLLTGKGAAVRDSLWHKVAEEKQIPKEMAESIPPEERIRQLIDGAFRPVYFYGRRVTDLNVSDFPDDRGPVERYKVLSRAPFYMFQLVSIFAESVYSPYDSTPIHRRNTDMALKTSIPELEDSIRSYRGKQ